jgi:hypothetical protein
MQLALPYLCDLEGAKKAVALTDLAVPSYALAHARSPGLVSSRSYIHGLKN